MRTALLAAGIALALAGAAYGAAWIENRACATYDDPPVTDCSETLYIELEHAVAVEATAERR